MFCRQIFDCPAILTDGLQTHLVVDQFRRDIGDCLPVMANGFHTDFAINQLIGNQMQR